MDSLNPIGRGRLSTSPIDTKENRLFELDLQPSFEVMVNTAYKRIRISRVLHVVHDARSHHSTISECRAVLPLRAPIEVVSPTVHRITVAIADPPLPLRGLSSERRQYQSGKIEIPVRKLWYMDHGTTIDDHLIQYLAIDHTDNSEGVIKAIRAFELESRVVRRSVVMCSSVHHIPLSQNS